MYVRRENTKEVQRLSIRTMQLNLAMMLAPCPSLISVGIHSSVSLYTLFSSQTSCFSAI